MNVTQMHRESTTKTNVPTIYLTSGYLFDNGHPNKKNKTNSDMGSVPDPKIHQFLIQKYKTRNVKTTKEENKHYCEKISGAALRNARLFFVEVENVVDGVVKERRIVIDVENLND